MAEKDLVMAVNVDDDLVDYYLKDDAGYTYEGTYDTLECIPRNLPFKEGGLLFIRKGIGVDLPIGSGSFDRFVILKMKLFDEDSELILGDKCKMSTEELTPGQEIIEVISPPDDPSNNVRGTNTSIRGDIVTWDSLSYYFGIPTRDSDADIVIGALGSAKHKGGGEI